MAIELWGNVATDYWSRIPIYRNTRTEIPVIVFC